MREWTLNRGVRAWAIALALGCAVPAAAQEGITLNQRPLSDFLSAQGTGCIDDGVGGCLLYVPPDPNFPTAHTDLSRPMVYVASVDYAGLAARAEALPPPTLTGTVTERPLPDGTAEVTVLLHAKNANIWVIQLDPTGDVLEQLARGPTVFGHRPQEVALLGAPRALADADLHVVLINAAPGAPLPDLASGAPLEFLSFNAVARGPLTAEFGVDEGTPGQATIVQNGLSGAGDAVCAGRTARCFDSFPGQITLRTAAPPRR